MDLPGLKSITAIVKAYRDELKTYDPEDIADEEGNPSGDIRLQVLSNGAWSVHTGDSQYDQDHRGAWGASSVSPNATDEECQEIAEDLLGQVEEDEGEDEEDED